MPAAAYPYCTEICFLSRQLQRYCKKPDKNFLPAGQKQYYPQS